MNVIVRHSVDVAVGLLCYIIHYAGLFPTKNLKEGIVQTYCASYLLNVIDVCVFVINECV